MKGQCPELQKLFMVTPTAGDQKKNLNIQQHSNRYLEVVSASKSESGLASDVSIGRSGDVPKGRREQESRNSGADKICRQAVSGQQGLDHNRMGLQKRPLRHGIKPEPQNRDPGTQTRYRCSLFSGKSRNLLWKVREEVSAELAKRVTNRELNTECPEPRIRAPGLPLSARMSRTACSSAAGPAGRGGAGAASQLSGP